MMRVVLCLLLACLSSLHAQSEVPVAYQGRIRPLEAATRLWQYNLSHSQKAALSFAWELHIKGHEPFDQTPLFWIQHADTKELLGLDTKQTRFSFYELQKKFLHDSHTNLRIVKALIAHHFADTYRSPQNRAGATRLELTTLSPGLWAALKGNDIVVVQTPNTIPWHHITPGTIVNSQSKKIVIDELLSLWSNLISFERFQPIHVVSSSEAPLRQQLLEAGSDFRVLPGKLVSGEWYSLRALDLPVGNFTVYSDALFEQIRREYAAQDLEALSASLLKGYEDLAGTSYLHGLNYPTLGQLRAEVFYYTTPLPLIALVIYFLAALFLALAATLKSKRLAAIGVAIMVLAFIIHTGILALRCYILARPPVANMFETVVYVPWIAVLCCSALYYRIRTPLLPLAACSLAVILLSLLEVTQLGSGMETLQPVLNSQYWLIIHVLLVVASYGVFLLSGILGHIYLGVAAFRQGANQQLAKAILHTMYLGTFMLLVGTILGGVWAAESWGRFWDWDPKEAWAFISICVYLICIHAYTFKHIRDRGLAVGSVVGLWAISFTWYGVNYILGTGLHSYGFGSGGEGYYYLFLAMDLLYVIASTKYSTQRREGAKAQRGREAWVNGKNS
ncbi:MAG: cytochrome c biogenesis protein CcsA [Chlamydiales bacterium]|nr:cytochrome c biogenesis protein CcsA [Chlamydiales bacterium]